MFIGHFALGFAAKRIVPQVSVAVLFAAAQFADLLWPFLVAAGIEHVRIDPGNTRSTPLDFVSYPYSHSLVMLIVWGALFAWIAARLVPARHVFAVIFVLVTSHWLLDYITHRPDMPLYPGGPRLGLGLWNQPVIEKSIEIAMYAAGLQIYLQTTRAYPATRRWAMLALAAFLFVGFFAASAPPPSVTALWISAIALSALTVVWAYWADLHRSSSDVRTH